VHIKSLYIIIIIIIIIIIDVGCTCTNQSPWLYTYVRSVQLSAGFPRTLDLRALCTNTFSLYYVLVMSIAMFADR